MKFRIKRLDQQAELQHLEELAGQAHSTLIAGLNRVAQSQLGGGRVAEHGRRAIERLCTEPALQNVLNAQHAFCAPVDSQYALPFGRGGNPTNTVSADIRTCGNIAICGGTRSERESLAAWLAAGMRKLQIPNLFSDDSGLWRRLRNRSKRVAVFLTHLLPRNLLAPGQDAKQYGPVILREIGKAYSIVQVTVLCLEDLLLRACAQSPDPPPSLDQFHNTVRVVASQQKNAKLRTAAAHLEPLLSLIGPENARIQIAPDLTKQYPDVVLENALVPRSARNLFTAHLYLTNLAKGKTAPGEARLAWFLEGDRECPAQLRELSGSGYVPPLLRSLNDAALYGVRHVITAPYPSQIDATVWPHCDTWAVFRLKDPKDIRTVQPYIRLPDEMADILAALQRNESLFFTPGCERPLRLATEPFNFVQDISNADQAVHTAQLQDQLRHEITLSPLHDAPQLSQITTQTSATMPPPPAADDPGQPDQVRRFLRAIAGHPDSGVTALYQEAGLNSDEGTRLKARLLAEGLLFQVEPQAGRIGRPKIHLGLTDKGKALIL